MSGPRNPAWQHAFTGSDVNVEKVIVPLAFEKGSQKLSKGYVSKLVVEKDATGEMHMFMVKATGNLLDVESGAFDLGGDQFSGIVEKFTWSGNFVSGEYYKNGIKVGTVYEEPPTGATAERLPGGEWVLVAVDWYTQACSPYGCEPMVYSWTETKYVWREDGQSDNAFYQTYYHEDPYSSGGGGPSTGGGSGSSPCSNEPDCFDLENVDFGEEINYDVEVIRPTAAEEWEEQIDDSQLKPCMQTIMSDLKNLTKGVGQIVQKFAGNNAGYNWKTVDGSLPQGTAATDAPTFYNTNTNSLTTTFDSQAWLGASDLSWARTILHEAIHADLAVYFAINRPGWIATYHQMVKEWGILQNWNDVHHEEMARSIVKDISLALQEYGNLKGYNYSQQFYDDMAWGGLQNSAVFNSLPSTDQMRILDTIAIELTGTDTNGNSKTQKGNNAGC